MFQVQSQEEETQKLDITTVPSSKVLFAAQHVSVINPFGYYLDLTTTTAFTKDFNAYLEYVKMLYIMIRVLYCGHT